MDEDIIEPIEINAENLRRTMSNFVRDLEDVEIPPVPDRSNEIVDDWTTMTFPPLRTVRINSLGTIGSGSSTLRSVPISINPTPQTSVSNEARILETHGLSTSEDAIATDDFSPPTSTFSRPSRRREELNKNQKTLNKFIDYCKAHPQERFWQALRNFGKDVLNHRMNFLLIAELDINSSTGYKNVRDTFYAD